MLSMLFTVPLIKRSLQSVWKPLFGPLNDWPLALCDASTVDAANDLVEVDHVYRMPDGKSGRLVENYAVYHSQRHRWYYLSEQSPDEILVFRQVDSSGQPGEPKPTKHHSLLWQTLTMHRRATCIILFASPYKRRCADSTTRKRGGQGTCVHLSVPLDVRETWGALLERSSRLIVGPPALILFAVRVSGKSSS
jgi:hypothetical protein